MGYDDGYKMPLMKSKPPGEQDWDWIIEKYFQTALESLPAETRNNISLEVIRENLCAQTEKLLEAHGVSNQIFMTHTGEQTMVGYNWAGRFSNGFTGEAHAHIINIYVEADCQGKGIRSALMLLSEDWARQQQFSKISLAVAAHNHSAIGLYGKIGF